MQIYVDADACPVVDIVEKIAKKYQIPVTLLCDTNHVLTSGYSEVVVVGAGADAVDYKLDNWRNLSSFLQCCFYHPFKGLCKPLVILFCPLLRTF